ncbi:MAG: DsbA family protein [Gammaproteobacteria bacterium]|nr:DsbA family protein [Gammaproteobacteria bacterium]NNJ83971.1 DsbA family protein [Gammaproteobacteria bacterium]
MKTLNTKLSDTLSTAHSIGAALILLLLTGFSQTFAADRALFQLNGMDYLESELPSGSQLALYELDNDYYQKVQLLIDEALFDIYLDEEAKREGKTRDEIRTARLLVAEPDESSVRGLYEVLRGRIKQPYEVIREQLAEHLHQQQIDAKKVELLADYRRKSAFRILLPRPVSPFVAIQTQGFPVRGNPKAPVTIVEFADYQCPHCKTASQTVKRVAKRFEGKVKVVYMDYLVTGSPISRLVAQGGVCADKQGKFWAYHDLAYKHQHELSKDSPVDLAEEIGLDQKPFKHCLKSEEAIAKVKQAEQEARRLQLNSTPSVFVNGKRVVLHDIEQDVIEAVEKALK